MIFGNLKTFAIESEIQNVETDLSLLALGFFNIIISGIRYGVPAKDATYLASTYDSIVSRIQMKGKHYIPEFTNFNAQEIAFAFRKAFYFESLEGDSFCGFSLQDFSAKIVDSGVQWAPDGDTAFDDGSYVLQFDIGQRVRLVGFKSDPVLPVMPGSVAEVELPADEYYNFLNSWIVWMKQQATPLPQ